MKYTHDSFCADCKELAERVKGYPFTHILSVERGGGYVVNELIKYYPRSIIVPIRVSFYDGQKKRATPIVEYAAGKVFYRKDKVLLVDDLCESGTSISFLKKHYILKKAGDVKVAVLLKKPTSSVEPDFCVRNGTMDWVQFPWEDEFGNHLPISASHTPNILLD